MFTKFSTGLVSGLLMMSVYSCKEKVTPTEYAKTWTAEIKKKVLEDAAAIPDSTKNDTLRHEITTFKNGKKLIQWYLAKRKDQPEFEPVIYDTGMIVYYSKDQNFQFVIQPCIQGAERKYEGVAYKGDRYGLAEYNYCRQNLKEMIFIIDNLNVGPLTRSKKDGTDPEVVQLGNDDKLEQLKEMKFYR